jgi:hypothetical protein
MHTDTNIPTNDDPVLRYVPFINDGQEYEDLKLFEKTDLIDRPLDRREELAGRLIIKVFSKYKQDELYRTKINLDNGTIDDGYIKKYYTRIYDLSIFLDITIV